MPWQARQHSGKVRMSQGLRMKCQVTPRHLGLSLFEPVPASQLSQALHLVIWLCFHAGHFRATARDLLRLLHLLWNHLKRKEEKLRSIALGFSVCELNLRRRRLKRLRAEKERKRPWKMRFARMSCKLSSKRASKECAVELRSSFSLRPVELFQIEIE